MGWQFGKSGGEREAGEGVLGTSWGSGEEEVGRRRKFKEELGRRGC